MLSVKNLEVYYGVINAIKGISFDVKPGEIVTLIGANGAGKTTILNTLSGLIKPKKGDILYEGQDIQKIEPHDIVRRGMAHVPEGRRIFPNMSVEDNLELGGYTLKQRSDVEEGLERAYKNFPRLKERRKQFAGTLSGGEQQMLAIARALMTNPKLVLMDEPSMGLAPILVKEIFEIIKDINLNGTTVLLVEQNANMALSIANRAYVLETGQIVSEGEASTLLNNDDIRKAYLGG